MHILRIFQAWSVPTVAVFVKYEGLIWGAWSDWIMFLIARVFELTFKLLKCYFLKQNSLIQDPRYMLNLSYDSRW